MIGSDNGAFQGIAVSYFLKKIKSPPWSPAFFMIPN
jgi:hypothetical protein